jgi:hypothetical protein
MSAPMPGRHGAKSEDALDDRTARPQPVSFAQALLLTARLADGIEGQVLGGGMMLLTPLLEEASVAQGHVFGMGYAEAHGHLVDPCSLAFQFGEVADGGLIYDTMSFAVAPLASPLLVAKGWNETQRAEDLRQRLAVGNLSFGFDAVLVPVFAGSIVGKALVGHGAFAAVVANAQDLGARPHAAVGRVLQNIALEGARGIKMEAGLLQPPGKLRRVVHAKLDFGLDGYHDF